MTFNRLLFLILVIGLIGGGYYYYQGEIPTLTVNNTDTQQEEETSTSQGVGLSAPSGNTAVPVSSGVDNELPPATAPSVGTATSFVVTPAGGESWTIGKNHEIRWNKHSGLPGSIALVNASTDQIVGWISPSTIAKQVTFNWDTRNLQITQTNPAKITVDPGTYYVQVIFSNPSISFRSDNFTLITNDNEYRITEQVRISSKNYIPNYLSLGRGEKVVIINDNQNENETILMGGVAVAVLEPRHSYVIDTSEMNPGEYIVRLASNTVTRLTLAVK